MTNEQITRLAKAAADSKLFKIHGKPASTRDMAFMITEDKTLAPFLKFRMEYKFSWNFKPDYTEDAWEFIDCPPAIRKKMTPVES